jgi:hypothetical protein
MPDMIQIPECRSSKVVQLYISASDKPIYVCDIPVLGAGEERVFRWHGEVLKSTLQRLGIPFDQIDLDSGRTGPKKEGNGYQLTGAGLCARIGDMLNFGEYSRDYGIGIDLEHINRHCAPVFEKAGLKWRIR